MRSILCEDKALTIPEQKQRWSLSSRELLLIVLFWTSLATLSVANRMLDPRAFGLREGRPGGVIAFLYAEAWLWAALTPLIFWLSSRLNSERAKWYVSVPSLLAAGVLIATGFDLVLELLRAELLPMPRRRGATFMFLRGFGRFRILNHLLIYLAVLAAGFAREYFVRDQRRQREAAALLAETAQLQAQLSAARLEALRMQLNPHFLFNTLHAVSALVERDPIGVRRMIARLSELLRHTIESRGSQEVTLRDELELLQRYSRSRLEQLYGDSGALTLSAAEGGGVVAEIRLPYHTASDLRTTGVGE